MLCQGDNSNKVITGVSDYSEAMLKKAKFMSSLADVTGTYSLFIVKGPHNSKAVGNTLLIKSEELKQFDDRDELPSACTNESPARPIRVNNFWLFCIFVIYWSTQ